ncbi:MAG: pantoate--beta-alanine ligase [Phycisphaerae bacterium]|nr:pantoate--beta-alanine ligase [Phycisphaerae bacterium]
MDVTTRIETVRERVDAARAAGKRIGFVPTMGALHAGHVSLMEAAGRRCEYVVVSIFVNPTQFGPNEDFDAYPRDITADRQICESAGVELVFAPGVGDMYPSRNLTWVTVESLTEGLCGRHRRGHFRGVTTVCNKLFNIVRPDAAFFGQKDAQQAIVVKRMVADTNLPLEVAICPTLREADGLAMSSRNVYLSTGERADALLLYRALTKAESMVRQGERNCSQLVSAMRAVMQSGAVVVEYISIVDTETLYDLAEIEDVALIAVAARVGKTRLIDNIVVDLNKPQGAI